MGGSLKLKNYGAGPARFRTDEKKKPLHEIYTIVFLGPNPGFLIG